MKTNCDTNKLYLNISYYESDICLFDQNKNEVCGREIEFKNDEIHEIFNSDIQMIIRAYEMYMKSELSKSQFLKLVNCESIYNHWTINEDGEEIWDNEYEYEDEEEEDEEEECW